MAHHQIVIGSRCSCESSLLQSKAGTAAVQAFHKSGPLLDFLKDKSDTFLILTPLLMDETALDILSQCAINATVYPILYACHAIKSINLLPLYGSGCAKIIGPDEIDRIPDCLQISEDEMSQFVIPPFLNAPEANINKPSAESSNSLHVSFLGSQALMSLCNALMNVPASGTMSAACAAPHSPWARAHLENDIQQHTHWKTTPEARILGGAVHLSASFNSLATLEPSSAHYIVCHGALSDDESAYISRLNPQTRVFTACDTGYVTVDANSALETVIAPHKLWKLMSNALYVED